MGVFGDLLNDLTGWLTIGTMVFMLVMMAYIFGMIVSKINKGE